MGLLALALLEQPEQEKMLEQERPLVPALELLVELAGSQSSSGGDTLDGQQRKPLIPGPGRV
jgi:hypothetical protein